MTLDQIDDAVRLRNFRRNVMQLADVAQSSFMTLKFTGMEHPEGHISLQVVRDAIVAECRREQAKYEDALRQLGVIVPDALSSGEREGER